MAGISMKPTLATLPNMSFQRGFLRIFGGTGTHCQMIKKLLNFQYAHFFGVAFIMKIDKTFDPVYIPAANEI